MITLTALVGLLGLGWLVQHVWKRVAKALARPATDRIDVAPARAS